MKNYKTSEIPKCILEKRVEFYPKDLFSSVTDIDSLKNNIKLSLKKKPFKMRFSHYEDILADCKSVVLE